MSKPLIVLDPQPRALNVIFDSGSWARLGSMGELAVDDGAVWMPADRLDPLLPRMQLLIGRSDMFKDRPDRAPNLRAIVNVETNFLQNVDYERRLDQRAIELTTGRPICPRIRQR